MIAYLIKTILTSGLLIAGYYVILENEKIHRFKRFYLLFSIISALVFPAVSITIDQAIEKTPSALNEVAFSQIEAAQNTLLPPAEAENFVDWVPYAAWAYAAITGLLLLRFLKNLLALRRFLASKIMRPFREAWVVTDTSVTIPFTFLNYIVVNPHDASNEQILLHEFTHTKEHHTFDNLFIELCLCVMWFNPFWFIYRKAIRLNHEFLADDQVVRQHPLHEYLTLLLSKSKQQKVSFLASYFNQSSTKKRFIMMSKRNNQKRAIALATASIIVVFIALVTFSQKMYAQGKPESAAAQNRAGATPEAVQKFDSLIYRLMHTTDSKSVKWICVTGISNEDKQKMEEIYKTMTAKQKGKYPEHVYMVFTPTPRPRKNAPTAKHLADLTDASVYGVWIDGKRIANNEMNKYRPEDFALMTTSKLMKNAAHYGKYVYQVDLMTHDYFDSTYPEKVN